MREPLEYYQLYLVFSHLLDKIARDTGYPTPAFELGLEEEVVAVRVDGERTVYSLGKYSFVKEEIWLYWEVDIEELLHEFRHHVEWIDFKDEYYQKKPEATLLEIVEEYRKRLKEELKEPWFRRKSEILAMEFAKTFAEEYRPLFREMIVPYQERLRKVLAPAKVMSFTPASVLLAPVHEVWYWIEDKPETARVTYVRAFTKEEAEKEILRRLGSPKWVVEVTRVFTEEEWMEVLGRSR